jgi:hypothetical protein
MRAGPLNFENLKFQFKTNYLVRHPISQIKRHFPMVKFYFEKFYKVSIHDIKPNQLET